MSKTTDNKTDKFVAYRRRVCRTAYILNNDQPVRCTIIGEQPLFYMDYDGVLDEELEAEFAAHAAETGLDLDILAIEEGIEALQQRIMESSTFATGPTADGEHTAARLEEFCADMSHATRPPVLGESMEYEPVEALLDSLSASRLADAYIRHAREHGITFAYSQQIAQAGYDRDGLTVFINPTLPRAERLLLAARELRRVWQHKNGALLHPLTFHPDQAILVNRAQIADLTVNMIRVGWELQLAGEKEPWERIENSGMADLARAFARESFLDFRTLNNGTAASAVFEAWFLSERCRQEDRKLIQNMLADYQGYVFDGLESSQAVTAELMAALGAMPFGKNYLAPYVSTITNDALFTEVRDRSNANFLWFIKFERSFREAEQELQSGGVTDGDALASDRSHKNKRIGDDEKTAHVIALPRGRAGTPHAENGDGGHGAQIIAFRGHATPSGGA